MSVKRFFQRARWDEERARELEAHLAMETDDNIARGMTPDRARAAARRKLGNMTAVREAIYDMNSVSWLETTRLDVRDALRQLRRRPFVTLLGFVLLTIGLGASAAAFSVAYGVFARPLPYPDANRLAVLWDETAGVRSQLSFPDFEDIRSAVPFQSAVAFGSGRGTLTGGADAERVNLVDGEPGLLPILGAAPIRGRIFSVADDGAHVAVISRRLWQTVFRGDEGIVGRPVGLSGTQHTIVGVVNDLPDFELPVGGATVGSGFTIEDVDVWTPLNSRDQTARNRAVSTYQAIVKLDASRTIDEVQHGVDVVATNLARAYPATNRARGFRLVPLHEQMVQHTSRAVWIAFAGAVLILVIACANLASLFVGELPVRRRDFALREALGASRGRLFRQLAIEGVLMSGASAIAGVAVARIAIESLKRASGLPRVEAIRFDLPVALCVAAAAVVAGLAARLAPVGHLRRAGEALRPSVASYAASAPALRRTLVAVQLGLAVALSSAAILFALSFRQLLLVDPGFAASHAMSARVSAFAARYPMKGDVTRFVTNVVNELSASPGIDHAAASSTMPLAGTSIGTSVGVAGRLVPLSDRPAAGWQTVTPGYFAALGIPLIAGRDFTGADLGRPSHLTVINQALARRMFGDANPLGQRLTFGPDDPVTDWHEVVGVVGDVRHGSLADAAAPRAYDLYGQHWSRTVYLVARGRGEPHALTPAIRETVRRLDSEAPVFEVQSLDDIIDATVAPRKLATGFAAGIAIVSVLLSVVGLYGLLASTVAARTRELGIRRALGSSTRAIVRMVFGEAVTLAVAGIVAGTAFALAMSRVLQSQLFGIRATDVRVMAATAALLAAVGALATWVPARRAARIDPAIALREE
jgi:putative ABC transport system permease protein